MRMEQSAKEKAGFPSRLQGRSLNPGIGMLHKSRHRRDALQALALTLVFYCFY